MTKLAIAWALLAAPTAWFSYWELRRVWSIERLSVLNVVPLFVAALALGARWPITAVERFAKYLAKLEN